MAASWEGKTCVLPDDHRGTFGSENIMPNGCLTIEPKPETTATNLGFQKKNGGSKHILENKPQKLLLKKHHQLDNPLISKNLVPFRISPYSP